MFALCKVRQLSAKTKQRFRTGLLLLCTAVTFMVPLFGGGYTVLKEPVIKGSATAMEDVDLPMVVASAFGEARKAMNATDLDKQEIFVNNTASIVDGKWQNIGLLVGPRDALSGTIWSTYQNPTTLSEDEVATYGNSDIVSAYQKYKTFGTAVQNLNKEAQRSQTSAVALNEGLDAMSSAVVKMGGFGVKFLNDYNPGPLLISLYDSGKMNDYPDNEWIKLVNEHEPLYQIVHLFGDEVAGTGLSFFLILGAVIAIVGFALSMFLILIGNRNFGDSIRKFVVRVVISAAGIYIISNAFSVALQWVNSTIGDVENSAGAQYAEQNLNLYDWYLTGFQLPLGVDLEIDETGNFVFDREDVLRINEFTMERVHDVASPDPEAIRNQIERYTQHTNIGMASYVTPIYSNGGDGEGEGWNTDKLYAYMGVYSQNIDLHDPDSFNVDTESPIHGLPFSIYRSKYTYMSSLAMNESEGGWTVKNVAGGSNYYGLNPISSFNLMRSDFSGSSISTIQNAYPTLAYAAFDVTAGVPVDEETETAHMNSITRFIACFTLVLATLRGFFTIITVGFGGLISGGVRTSVGSAGGLGQALGAVVALIGGILGISLIMSISISLLDVIYGIAMSLIGDTAVIEAFLQPMLEGLRKIPFIGPWFASLASSAAEGLMTLIMVLTIPKLGGIPINLFTQWISDVPSRMSEKAMMLENMLFNGRTSAGYGGGGGSRSGQYARSAAAQAGQAFNSGTRQAALVLGAGAAAAKSLAGAGLAAGGRALNSKADNIEGKPNNPGIADWDDLTPEQQANAAQFAAAYGDEWQNMDSEERKQAMEDAGIYDNTYDPEGRAIKDETADGEVPGAPADDGSSSESEGFSELETPDAPVTGTDPESVNTGAIPSSMDTGDTPMTGTDPGSLNGDVSGMAGQAEGMTIDDRDSVSETSGAADQAAAIDDRDSLNGNVSGMAGHGTTIDDRDSVISGGNAPDGQRTAPNGSTLSADGKTRAEGSPGTARAGSLNTDSPSDLANRTKQNGLSAPGTNASNPVHQTADGGQSMGLATDAAETGSGHLSEGGSPGTTDMGGQGSITQISNNTAGDLHQRVENRQDVDGKQVGDFKQSLSENTMEQNIHEDRGQGLDPASQDHSFVPQMDRGTGLNEAGRTPGSVQSDTGMGSLAENGTSGYAGMTVGGRNITNLRADNRKQSSSMSSAQMQSNSQHTETAQKTPAQKTAVPNAGQKQGMNGTSKSRYGKEMTIREQRQARALHAMGDALQMAGGNRTMKEGIVDALGYAKDGLMTAAVPEEAQPLVRDIRLRRMERSQRELVRNSKREPEKKKK